jgi:ribosomal protein S18 acetylase RimI-like enzyme
LSWFGVAKPYQKMGIGRRVIDNHIAMAKLLGGVSFSAFTESRSNNEAQTFYRKLGFYEFGNVFEWRGHEQMVFRKNI